MCAINYYTRILLHFLLLLHLHWDCMFWLHYKVVSDLWWKKSAINFLVLDLALAVNHEIHKDFLRKTKPLETFVPFSKYNDNQFKLDGSSCSKTMKTDWNATNGICSEMSRDIFHSIKKWIANYSTYRRWFELWRLDHQIIFIYVATLLSRTFFYRIQI